MSDAPQLSPQSVTQYGVPFCLTPITRVEQLDPKKEYNVSKLASLRIGRNRHLVEALRNDPLAPLPRFDKNSKLYLGAKLIAYINNASADLTDAEKRLVKKAAYLVELESQKMVAELQSERAKLETERAQLQAEREKWCDAKIEQVRQTVREALSNDQVSKISIDPSIRKSGIYFLRLRGEIVYVGQSVNMFSRIWAHTDKSFDEVSFFQCQESDLNQWEGFFIRLLRPCLNSPTMNKEKGKMVGPSSLLWDRVVEWRASHVKNGSMG